MSAKTPAALDAATANLARFLRDSPDVSLADVAHTLQVGRQAFAHRRAIAAVDAAEAVELLESNDPKRVAAQHAGEEAPAVAFMFAGGGAQHATMGAHLYGVEPLYRAEIDRCLAFMKTKYGVDLAPLMFPLIDEAEQATLELERPSLALPALFSTQLALAKLLMSWGIKPQAMIGHSMGEYTAACLADVFSVEDALSLVTVRGRLFERLAEGGMLSVPLAAEELRPMLPPELSIAAVNAPELCVASGPVKAIEAFERTLAAQEIDCRRIHINVAAHSVMLEPILQEFGTFVRGIALRAPRLPFVSNVTGTWITESDATDPGYWVRHLRQTVRFADGVGELLADPRRVLLEVGPGRTLTTLARQHSAKQASHGIYPSMRHPDEQVSDVAFALGAVGRLWTHGVEVDWGALHGEEHRHRIPLPTYPFERQRHWIAPGKGVSMAAAEDGPPRKRPDVAQWLYQPSWRRTTPSAIVTSPDAGPVLLFADGAGLGAKVAEGMRAVGRDVWTVTVGKANARIGERDFTIALAAREAYETLFRDLAAEGVAPTDIVHCFSVTPPGAVLSAEHVRDLSFYSVLYLAQAVIAEDLSYPIRLSVVSSDMQQVAGEAVLTPEKAQLLGPCKVIAQEVPNVRSRSIDVVLPPSGSWQERQLVQQLIGEIGSPVTDEVVALRGADRWVQTFESVAVDPNTRPSRVRDGGVYLITGGLGGIGLTVAEYLARAAKARLVLVGRTAFPAREEWDGWVARRGENDRVSRAITQVRALEALGSEVMVARGDVTDRREDGRDRPHRRRSVRDDQRRRARCWCARRWPDRDEGSRDGRARARAEGRGNAFTRRRGRRHGARFLRRVLVARRHRRPRGAGGLRGGERVPGCLCALEGGARRDAGRCDQLEHVARCRYGRIDGVVGRGGRASGASAPRSTRAPHGQGRRVLHRLQHRRPLAARRPPHSGRGSAHSRHRLSRACAGGLPRRRKRPRSRASRRLLHLTVRRAHG